MAGGTFDKYVGKVRPGTYINFVSGRDADVLMGGIRGTVVVPLAKPAYGPAGKYIKLSNASPDAAAATFGYSIYDNDPNRQMLYIREAFKQATTVYVYIMTEGEEAKADVKMVLPEPEVSGFDKQVTDLLKTKLGTNEQQAGCNMAYDSRDKIFTVTLLGAANSVKNTGAVVAAKELLTQGYSITVDGTRLNTGDLTDFLALPLWKTVTSMNAGDPDIRVSVVISKENDSQEYTVVITYPKPPAGAVSHGVKDATMNVNTLKCTAKYGGSRGNALTVTLDLNPLGGFDVIVHLDGVKVTEYEGLTTVEQLIAMDNPYITFSGSGYLGEVAGTNLSGGTDEELHNADISKFIDSWENVRFNTVCFPFDGEDEGDISYTNLKFAALTKIKYMRENMGRGVQAVIPNAGKMDYEGVINVTNSVSLDGDDLTVAEACAWVAGATAGADYIESLTYVPYAGATAVVGEKSNEDAVTAINNGEFFFSFNENDEVVVEYDVNSLTTFIPKVKDKSYRKNRVIRAHDALQETIQLNFPPNKFSNDDEGWNIMEGVGKTILRMFDDKGAIMNVDLDTDFLVDREMSKDDETYFNVGAQFVDSAEKLYFTVTTR